MKKIMTTLFLLTITMQLFAQSQGSALTDALFASEKIYVVAICAGIILLGLLLFLFSIERRLKKLEKKS